MKTSANPQPRGGEDDLSRQKEAEAKKLADAFFDFTNENWGSLLSEKLECEPPSQSEVESKRETLESRYAKVLEVCFKEEEKVTVDVGVFWDSVAERLEKYENNVSDYREVKKNQAKAIAKIKEIDGEFDEADFWRKRDLQHVPFARQLEFENFKLSELNAARLSPSLDSQRGSRSDGSDTVETDQDVMAPEGIQKKNVHRIDLDHGRSGPDGSEQSTEENAEPQRIQVNKLDRIDLVQNERAKVLGDERFKKLFEADPFLEKAIEDEKNIDTLESLVPLLKDQALELEEIKKIGETFEEKEFVEGLAITEKNLIEREKLKLSRLKSALKEMKVSQANYHSWKIKRKEQVMSEEGDARHVVLCMISLPRGGTCTVGLLAIKPSHSPDAPLPLPATSKDGQITCNQGRPMPPSCWRMVFNTPQNDLGYSDTWQARGAPRSKSR